MQFGFMHSKSTTEVVFIVRQLQEKYLGKHKKIYLTFVDLEKAFNMVPREIIWWVICKLGIKEWLLGAVMSLYENAKSNV